jgi:transposase
LLRRISPRRSRRHPTDSRGLEFIGERVIDEHWQRRVEQLLASNRELLATSIHRIVKAEGFTGSYPTLARYVREVRGTRREKGPQVSVTIETAPAEEGQADWSDCKDWGRAWAISDELQCFGAILSWSRHRLWWFADSCDRAHTLEGLVRFFEDCGGYAGDRCQEASSSRRARSPSKIFLRPIWPLATASSR